MYLTATLLRYDLILSDICDPPWQQVLMVVKDNLFGGDQTAHEQDSVKTPS